MQTSEKYAMQIESSVNKEYWTSIVKQNDLSKNGKYLNIAQTIFCKPHFLICINS